MKTRSIILNTFLITLLTSSLAIGCGGDPNTPPSDTGNTECTPGESGSTIFTSNHYTDNTKIVETTYSNYRYDMDDLPHGYYYEWGIGWDIPTNETITGASLFFQNIKNWDNSSNALFVNLLDDAAIGLNRSSDNRAEEVDYFDDEYSGIKVDLKDYYDLGTTKIDLEYDFSDTQVGILASYLSDGVFGLGLDPDCHFYNDGIFLTITTFCEDGVPDPVPEPGTLLLFASGLLGFAGINRRRKHKKITS